MPTPQCDLCLYEPECWVPLYNMSDARSWEGRCRKGHRVYKDISAPGRPPIYQIERPWTGTADCKDFESLVPF